MDVWRVSNHSILSCGLWSVCYTHFFVVASVCVCVCIKRMHRATQPIHMHTQYQIYTTTATHSTAPIVLKLNRSHRVVLLIRALYNSHESHTKMWIFIIHSVSERMSERDAACEYFIVKEIGLQKSTAPSVGHSVLSFFQSTNYGILDFWNCALEFHSEQLNLNQLKNFQDQENSNFKLKRLKRVNRVE